MTRTIVASRTRETAIGPGEPFRVIGERINPTGRRALTENLLAGRYEVAIAEARAQALAGADILDVNVGVDVPDAERSEPPLLAGAVEAVQSVLDLPLVIDSRFAGAVAAGLAVAEGRPLLNSVNGAEESLARLLPLAARHGVPVVALCHDGTELSADPARRFDIAQVIVGRAADHGIPRNDVLVDPLLTPADADGAGRNAILVLIARLRSELRVNTIVGLSNISFGAGERSLLNAGFLEAAIAAGLTAAIMNPLGSEMAIARARGSAGEPVGAGAHEMR